MQAIRLEQQVNARTSQILPAMQSALTEVAQRELGPAAGSRIVDTLMPQLNVVVREEFAWQRLKPELVAMYAEALTQEEADALIALYHGPLGRALLDKLPPLEQRSMEIVSGSAARHDAANEGGSQGGS